MTGKIIKGIAGFYYVNNGENKVYQCKAKGIFRNRKIKPLVGDDVEFTVLDEETMEGNIDEILPRKNELIRPAAANVDQALVLFALTHPAPNARQSRSSPFTNRRSFPTRNSILSGEYDKIRRQPRHR